MLVKISELDYTFLHYLNNRLHLLNHSHEEHSGKLYKKINYHPSHHIIWNAMAGMKRPMNEAQLEFSILTMIYPGQSRYEVLFAELYDPHKFHDKSPEWESYVISIFKQINIGKVSSLHKNIIEQVGLEFVQRWNAK